MRQCANSVRKVSWVKGVDSTYEPGERSGAWMKHRTNMEQELVICGYIPQLPGAWADTSRVQIPDLPNLTYRCESLKDYQRIIPHAYCKSKPSDHATLARLSFCHRRGRARQSSAERACRAGGLIPVYMVGEAVASGVDDTLPTKVALHDERRNRQPVQIAFAKQLSHDAAAALERLLASMRKILRGRLIAGAASTGDS